MNREPHRKMENKVGQKGDGMALMENEELGGRESAWIKIQDGVVIG